MQPSDVIALDLRAIVAPADTAGRHGRAACTPACPELSERTRQLEQQRTEDLAAVVAALREALTALGAEMASWQGDVHASTTRISTVVSQPDPERLRTMVLDEVRTLKGVIVSRRQRWDAVAKAHSAQVSALEVQLRTTRAEAGTDALTGLANRRAFDRELERRLRTSYHQVILAVFDVDDFKGVNDSAGHAHGDEVLKAIGAALTQSMRPGDLVARLGGDEFAVIAGGLTLGQAEHRFATLVGRIAESIHPVSCGLAEFSAGDSGKSLYDRADAALYDAKHAGKLRVATRRQPYLRDR